MRELSTCDFCGDEAAGVYEVVPESVDAPTATRRLALCANCRETLSGVVSPLLDRLGATPEHEEAAGERAGEEPSSEGEGPSQSESGERPRPERSRPPRRGTTTQQPASGASADSSQSGDDPLDPPATSTDAEDATDDAESGRDADDAESGRDADAPGDSATGSSGGPRPAGYRKLLRLVENREGAMSRDDLRALATNAYELSDEAFEKIVDAAVENGDLEETAGGLRSA